MKHTNTFHSFVGVVLKVTEILVCLTLAFLVLDVLWGVFSRYVLGEQSRWTEEVAIHLLIWVSLIGAAATYYENGHLGVDYIVPKWDPKTKRIGEFMTHIIVLLFVFYGLLYGGWALVSEAIDSGQVSPAVGVPMYVVYAAVPVSGALFTLFALDRLIGFFTGAHEPETHTTTEVV